jgi:predicted MFS family arabinose efflux permease
LLYLCNFADGADQYKHVNVALQFSKDQYSTIASLGFTVPFAFLSLVAGQLTDKLDRRAVIATACTMWSATTVLHGAAADYNQLVSLRVIVGASQAFFNPAAFTLIADIFPPALVGTMSGVLSSGIFLGGAVASLSVVLDEAVGWRGTMAVTGGVGVLAALCAWVLVRDPRPIRAQPVADEIPNAQANANWVTPLQEVFSTQEARLLFAASALRFCAGFSIIVWKAPFVFAKFPGQVAAFAGGNALVVGLGGLLSSLLGGYLSDRMASSGGPVRHGKSGESLGAGGGQSSGRAVLGGVRAGDHPGEGRGLLAARIPGGGVLVRPHTGVYLCGGAGGAQR